MCGWTSPSDPSGPLAIRSNVILGRSGMEIIIFTIAIASSERKGKGCNRRSGRLLPLPRATFPFSSRGRAGRRDSILRPFKLYLSLSFSICSYYIFIYNTIFSINDTILNREPEINCRTDARSIRIAETPRREPAFLLSRRPEKWRADPHEHTHNSREIVPDTYNYIRTY